VGSPQEGWIQIPWRGREPGLRSWEYIDFVAVGGYSTVQIAYPERIDIVDLSEEEPGGGEFDLGFAVVDIVDTSDKVSARFKEVRQDTMKPSLRIRRVGDRAELEGSTYHIRDVLKRLGFRWDPKYRVWYKPTASVWDVARLLRSENLDVEVV